MSSVIAPSHGAPTRPATPPDDNAIDPVYDEGADPDYDEASDSDEGQQREYDTDVADADAPEVSHGSKPRVLQA